MAVMRIACLQLPGPHSRDTAARLGEVQTWDGRLPDADLIMLPELWRVGFFGFDDYASTAEAADGPTTAHAVELARSRGAWVHGGSFVERDGDRLHNTSVLVDPAGAVRLQYRKSHLFGYKSAEAQLLTPGDGASVIDMDGIRVGAVTCYDLRFPELFRQMLDEGAEMFCVTSAWPRRRLDHWRTLCRARAIENLAWLVACNGGGADNGVPLAGHSMVVDPWGEVVAEADEEPAVLTAEIDIERVREIRAEFPFLEDRRPTA
jgi:predicted amidohydrolase